MEKILIVDDDENICELLKLYIERSGYETIIAKDGIEAVKKFNETKPALIVLDLMLPGMDGIEVCKEIRKTSDCPIIMLTAKGEIFDKVLGLEIGADDYMVKPFEGKEVTARIKAILRRTHKNQENTDPKVINYDGLSLDMSTYEMKVRGKVMNAPPKEKEIIYLLASHPNQVFTRDQLLDKIWGFDYFGDSRTVDVHIKRIRKKLEGVSDQWELKTVWGVGYRFEVKSDEQS
ncbi:MAG: response regulator transcription factor [Clostridia bacterium]|nr:response regulator transcription factor [Clostridia bacterium]